jgi:hypothetical protein
LIRAAGTGLSVLVVAHQRKSLGEFGEAVRGSNALIGGVDIVAELERPRADALAGDGVRILRAVSRYATTPEEMILALTEEGYEARGDSLTAQADVQRDQVFEAIETLGEASYEQLEKETGLSESTLRRRIEELDGRVSRIGAGKRNDPFRFITTTSNPGVGGKEKLDGELPF